MQYLVFVLVMQYATRRWRQQSEDNSIHGQFQQLRSKQDKLLWATITSLPNLSVSMSARFTNSRPPCAALAYMSFHLPQTSCSPNCLRPQAKLCSTGSNRSEF